MRRVLFITMMLLSQLAFSQKYFLGMVKTGAPACPYVASSWVSTTNWQESPTGVWGPITYVGVGNGEGLVNASASGDGYIQSDYAAADNQSTAIFLTTSESPTSPFYANVEYGLYVSAGAEYSTAISGSYAGLGVTAIAGDKFRVIRTGTTIKGQYFRSGAWTDLYTYGTYSGTLWMGVSSADPGNAVYATNPKYCN